MASTPGRRERSWRPDASLLDGLTLPAVAVDVGGVVVYANRAAGRLFDAGLLRGSGPSEAFLEVLGVVLGTGSWTGEMTLPGAGGRPTTVVTSWSVHRQDGEVQGALLVVVD